MKDFAPETGIVLGSGLGSLVERCEVRSTISFSEIPNLPVSKVPGHAGRFVFGELAGRRVVLAQGRVHLYEGHSAAAVTAGVRAMASLGISTLILTNAAGSLRAEWPVGNWMMLNDHINLTGASPLTGGPHFLDQTCVYDAALREKYAAAAAAQGVELHEGVYASLPGPQYETPAEVRMLRVLGADAVGMSTVLEAIQARALGLRVAAFSCLTNHAAGLGPEPLSHSEVLATGTAAAAQLARVLAAAL